MTVNMLIQIDKLVQLLESPVFTCMCLGVSMSQTSLNMKKTFVYSFLSPRNTLICTNASMVS